jgi:hypothetical protein
MMLKSNLASIFSNRVALFYPRIVDPLAFFVFLTPAARRRRVA